MARLIFLCSAHRASLLLFFILWLAYGCIHQNVSEDNSISRLDLLCSAFLQGSLAIDAYSGNTPCKSMHDGHYYSDKAPGVAVLAAPAFGLALSLLSLANVPPASEPGMLFSSWLATFGSVSLITAAGGVFMFHWLSRWVSRRNALAVTIGIFLGAAPFPYGTMLMSHGAVVGLLSAALWAGPDFAGTESLEGNPNRRWRLLLAGFCGGLAVACEYSAALVVGEVFLLAAVGQARGQSARALFLIALGAAPPLALIPAYHWICFGSPLTLAYGQDTGFTGMNDGFFGIGGPKLNHAAELLLWPARGLFWWSPFLLLAFFAYHKLYARSRPWFLACVLVPVVQVTVISGFADWRAGTTLGPRYLAPILPFLAVPAALAFQRSPRCGSLLILASIALTGLGTLVDATPGYGLKNPLWELHIPSLRSNFLTHNVATMIGIPSPWSAILYFTMLATAIALAMRGVSEAKERGVRSTRRPVHPG